MNIFDLVTANEIATYWKELNVNTQPLLGETLFPMTKEIGIKLEWIKGANNQPVALKLSAYDVKAIRRDRKGIEKYETEMPFFKESKYIDEKMRQDLNTMIQTNNRNLVNQILQRIFKDEIELIEASYVALERMRMQCLTTGQVVLESNGQAYSYDYGVPSDQKIEVAKSWSDATADIINDINSYKDLMKAKGVNITRAVCNSSVAKYFLTNNAMKNAIYVLGQGLVNLTQASALSYIQAQTGVTLLVYDNVYVNESGAAVKYVPDNTIIFMPDGTLGNTHVGITPAESDLQNSLTANVSIVGEGIAVTTHKEHDPVNVETIVSMVALPSFEKADSIVIVDVIKD